MKHLLLSFARISIMLCALCVAVPTFAIDLGIDTIVTPSAVEGGYEEASETSFSETVGSVIRAALSLLGVVFTLLIVYGGMIWMLARGNDGEVERAQKIIRNAAIGLIITVGAYAITNFVLRAFVG